MTEVKLHLNKFGRPEDKNLRDALDELQRRVNALGSLTDGIVVQAPGQNSPPTTAGATDHGGLTGLVPALGDFNDDHTQYVTTTPQSNIRNDITPGNSAIVAARALNSHFVTGGTGAPSGAVIDSRGRGAFIVESGSGSIYSEFGTSVDSTSPPTPTAFFSNNLSYNGSGISATVDKTRVGLAIRASIQEQNKEGGQITFLAYPMAGNNLTTDGIQGTARAITASRDLMRFRCNFNSTSGNWDGRGSMVLGLVQGTVTNADAAGEVTNPWTYNAGSGGGDYKARLAVYNVGEGTEILTASDSAGSDVSNMHGIMICKETTRIPGNRLRWEADRSDESDQWGTAPNEVHAKIQGIPLYIRTKPTPSGVGGLLHNNPGRILQRFHVSGVTSGTSKQEVQFGATDVCLDIACEFKPQLSINQNRFVFESGDRIMLRPDRVRTNIGPAIPNARMAYQGGFDLLRGAVEIDGRIRLWALGASTTPDAAHAPLGFGGGAAIENTEGIDFGYDRTANLLKLYSPGSATEKAGLSGASIDPTTLAGVLDAYYVRLDGTLPGSIDQRQEFSANGIDVGTSTSAGIWFGSASPSIAEFSGDLYANFGSAYVRFNATTVKQQASGSQYICGSNTMVLDQTGLNWGSSGSATNTITPNEGLKVTNTVTSSLLPMLYVLGPAGSSRPLFQVTETSGITPFAMTQDGITDLVMNNTHTLKTFGAAKWTFNTGGAVVGACYDFTNNSITIASIGSLVSTFDTPVNITDDSLTLGEGFGGGDPTITFNGTTYDGALAWDDSANYFQTSNDFRFDGHVGIGIAPQTDALFEVSWADGAVSNKVGLSFVISNSLNSGGVVKGFAGFCQSGTGNGHATSYTGGEAFATFQASTGGIGGSGIRGIFGKGQIKDLGASGGLVSGGDFETDIIGDWSNGVGGRYSTGGYGIRSTIRISNGPLWANGTLSTAYNYYARVIATGGRTNTVITNAAGLRIDYDVDLEATNHQAVWASAHPFASATKGNFYQEGGDWDDGHLQLSTGHIWFDATDSVLKFKGSAPTGDPDGIGFLQTAANTNTPSGATIKQLEIFAEDGVKYYIPVYAAVTW